MRRLSFPLCGVILVVILLLTAPARAQETTLPPLTGPVVAATPAQMDRILLYDMTGTRRELAFGPYEHQIWDFSPDGCRILFTLAEPGGLPQTYTARIDGSDMQPLLAYADLPPSAWGTWEPDWSAPGPDGVARVAFTMMRERIAADGEIERETHTAWVDPAAGLPQEPQFYSVTGREFSPQWSPDGAWLAYISYDERAAGADAFSTAEPTAELPPGQPAPEIPTVREADLWVVSADGETKYRLTDFSTGSVRAPRWSPDGALVGFIYSPSPANDMFWMIANTPGAIPTQLNVQWNLTLALTWLPDSSAMLAAVRDFRGMSENRLWRIPLVGNADDSAELYLADDAFIHADYPRFSADGRYLALRSTYTLTVVDTVEGSWQRLDPNLPGNTPPVWSPVGFTTSQDCAGG